MLSGSELEKKKRKKTLSMVKCIFVISLVPPNYVCFFDVNSMCARKEVEYFTNWECTVCVL